jgi:RNA polymerase sigma-70 factor (ECF subfamily)
MDHELTNRQRQVLEAIVFEDVPLDEVAQRWDSNRNATYKLLHDARRKLKAALEARGYELQDVLELFSVKA